MKQYRIVANAIHVFVYSDNDYYYRFITNLSDSWRYTDICSTDIVYLSGLKQLEIKDLDIYPLLPVDFVQVSAIKKK